MDWLAFPLANILTWFFQNVMEPLENLPNFAFVAFMFAGFAFWVKTQIKYNEEAKRNPDQIK